MSDVTNPVVELSPFVGNVTHSMMTALANQGSAVTATYAAAMDQEGNVHWAMAGPRGVEDLTSIRVAQGLLGHILQQAPSAMLPYLVNAQRSLSAALAVREEAEARRARGLH